MKPRTISDSENMIMAMQDEIRRTEESRYDHRLHGVLLVAQGMTCPKVAELLGDAPHSVVNWVERFEQRGFAGLAEGERSGRPARLSAAQLVKVESALRRDPSAVGMTTHLWDGPTLSAFLRQKLGVTLQVRQCQRLFRQMGFRLRKPRPEVAQADPQLQRAHKKTPAAGT
jgi:transposase